MSTLETLLRESIIREMQKKLDRQTLLIASLQRENALLREKNDFELACDDKPVRGSYQAG